MKHLMPVALTLLASPVLAETARQLDAHEHGLGALNIAVDGDAIAMELEVPGADIVGFEYVATSAEDRAKIEDAIAILARPLDLFLLPEAAQCTVTQATAKLETEKAHDDHDDHGHDDHDDHGHDDHASHGDDDHASHGHDDHDHDEHAHDEDKHDDHAHDDHAEDKHDDHAHDDHDDHTEEASHSEFHAEYAMTCADPTAIDSITFAYFEAFPNALALDIQIVGANGAQAFEVERDAPELDLRGSF